MSDKWNGPMTDKTIFDPEPVDRFEVAVQLGFFARGLTMFLLQEDYKQNPPPPYFDGGGGI